MAFIGTESSRTELNYNQQSFADSFNEAYNSTYALDNVGNVSVTTGGATQTQHVAVYALAGVLVLGAIALLKKG